MKKIVWITTGGTIACTHHDDGLSPTLDSKQMLEALGPYQNQAEILFDDLLQIDSTNMQPEEWGTIAQRMAEYIPHVDGIICTHGTDTLAYTASALSFMLENVPIPIILTGSQLPLEDPLSDGYDNIRCAFAAAMSDLHGIYIAFNRKIMLGTRTVKIKTMGFDAFESINEQAVGIINAKGLQINHQLMPKIKGEFKLHTHLCKKVQLIKLFPGMDPMIFDVLVNMGMRGIIIEAFGAGGINFIRRDCIAKLERLSDAGISVVVCSQCLYENSDFSIYQVGQKALKHNVIQSFDMTSEACVAKLMWALGISQDPKDVKQLFEKNFANEIKI